MRNLITLTLIMAFGLSIFLTGPAQAKTASKKKEVKKEVSAAKAPKASPSSDKNSQLGTSFSFDAASVRGKYQMAGQGIALVEDEKVLDDLLGIRKNFKDREAQEASRR